MKKTTFIGASVGITLVALLSYGYAKKKELAQLIKALEFKVTGLSNFKVSFKNVGMDLRLQALNPTSTPLYINTGFLKAKVLRVYHKKTRKLLAFTRLNTSEIDIPSGGFYAFAPIHIEIPVLTGGELLLKQLINKQGLQDDFARELAFELDIVGLGNTHTLEF